MKYIYIVIRCHISIKPIYYTQSGESVHRLFETQITWDAALSGSQRSQCNLM